MENNQRRDFLKKSILGISGAALLPHALRASTSTSQSAIPSLPGRILGKTGLKIPLISMGTSGATNPGFIRSAYDAGIKLFFSATYYGQGNNEILVGNGLKDLPRDSYTIGTACGADGLDQKTGTFTNGFNTEAYIRKAEESLKRFGIDYIDFLLFPYAGKREMVLHEGVLKAMQELKKQGKVRFVGIASHDNTEEALKAAADSGVYDIAMPAYNYKSAGSATMDEALAYAAKAGIGIVAMKTTAGAARSKSGPALNTNAALKWVLRNENVASIVSGMSSVEEMQKNLAMIQNLKMTDQEMKDLNLAGVLTEPGLYCNQCKECLPQCPANLDIPTLMRGYMYAYGYRNLEHAYYTVADSGLSGNPCDLCDDCKVNCRAGFNVQEKVRDIARLREVPVDFLMV
jgi:aryl-alcohol dehydrogenase-like predicted oxidoreductase